MFTGIIQAIGRVQAITRRGADARLTVATGALPLDHVTLGDSIACNGVCLTVVSLTAEAFVADVSAETLRCTTLGRLRVGASLNLENALTLGAPMGGHWISGHVDGVGVLQMRRDQGRAVALAIEAPAPLSRYLAQKGAVTVDGVSLTVNAVAGRRFELTLVPHTLGVTTLSALRPGDRVNLEVDIIARYLERLIMDRDQSADDVAGLAAVGLARPGGPLRS